MSAIDLHTHTTASDGTFTPTQLVEHAREKNLEAVAITDHDTTSGIDEAIAAGALLGLEVISGIELTTEWRGNDIHILGYGIDADSMILRDALLRLVAQRSVRNEAIAEKMRHNGIQIDVKSLAMRFPDAIIGRPHFARVLVEQGIAENISDAFFRFLGNGCAFYVPREHLSFQNAIGLIRASGGVAVIAHPLQYHFSDDILDALVAEGVSCGASGIEVHYTGYTMEQQERLSDYAQRYRLISTGGSDFHGANKPDIELAVGTGALHVPKRCLHALKSLIAAR